MKIPPKLLLVVASLTLKASQAATLAQSHPLHHDSFIAKNLGNDCNAPSASRFEGVHLLVENDLDSRSPRFPIILISKKASYADGMALCKCLGESGYTPLAGGANLSSIFVNTPVAVEEVASVSTFWVDNVVDNNQSCMAVDRTGASQYVACDSRLPTLCFNTAPDAHFLVPDTHRQIKVSTPKAGIFQGYRDGNSFRFLGIPYARPPVGELRFREPSPYVPTDESKVQDATKYGNVCPQQMGNDVQARLGTILTNQVSENEDCLYLNVYTPSLKASSTRALLPVMVYIHGGGLAALSGSTPLFEPGNLVSRGGIVVVTINYRLGILGVFQNKAGGIPASEAPGNLATRDQIMALQWVRDNIAAFGGDPHQITLVGQSAGGYSIRALLGTPSADSLYKNVIVQSDPVEVPLANETMIAYVSSLAMKALGCDEADIACARRKPYVELMQAQSQAVAAVYNPPGGPYSWILPAPFFRPAVDHELVMGDLFQLAPKSQYNHVANILWGFVKEDAGIFVGNIPNPIPLEGLNSTTANFAPGFPGDIFLASPSLYPVNASDPDGVRGMLSIAATDWYFRCPLLNITRTVAPQSSDVYTFQFNHGRELPPQYSNGFCASPEHLCHGEDGLPTFGNGDYFLGFGQTSDDARFSRQVMDRFTTFAKTGSPNPTPDQRGYEYANIDVASVKWDPVTPAAESILLFDLPKGEQTQALERMRCSYIEQSRPYDFLAHEP
ncbi:alpha/beta-hydrolase [Linnemannia elongata AG-77]|uniref:Alpha/beta-hydrolase n=1 Tax=Linnemannia elongata AG-77 TaxID=1314771 RepID=A0A197JCR9_9FUNG|nr:alpha/beta-hydrolase [Linnemannia elongata AG-77]